MPSSPSFGMTERVTRHRGGGRDENGQIVTPSDEELTPIAIAPGGGTEFVDRLRDGESIACIVYFATGTDVVNSDRLTVRGDDYGVIVNDWRLPTFGGLEVLCTRGQG